MTQAAASVGNSPSSRSSIAVRIPGFNSFIAADRIRLRSLCKKALSGPGRKSGISSPSGVSSFPLKSSIDTSRRPRPLRSNGGIHYTSVGDRKPSRFVDLRIENNEIYHVDRSGIFGWADSWVRSKWFPSLGVVVRGNRLHDIGGDGIVVVATDGALVERNVVGHATTATTTTAAFC